MPLQTLVTRLAASIREFVVPSYRPELHYMRGFGPACARRAVLVESKRVLPLLRREGN
jgi:hypothetical protein